MTDFKAGDDVWFFYTEYGKNVHQMSTVICPDLVFLSLGAIVDVNPKRDWIYIYVEDEIKLYNFPYEVCDDYLFKSKNEAIDAMIEHLKGMRE